MSRNSTTRQKRAVTGQPEASVATLSSEQILATIEQLHACYDYCAAWKEPTQEEDRAKTARSGGDDQACQPAAATDD